jgi:hypothetical protein
LKTSSTRMTSHASSDSPTATSYTQKLWMRVKRKAAYLPG